MEHRFQWYIVSRCRRLCLWEPTSDTSHNVGLGLQGCDSKWTFSVTRYWGVGISSMDLVALNLPQMLRQSKKKIVQIHNVLAFNLSED